MVGYAKGPSGERMDDQLDSDESYHTHRRRDDDPPIGDLMQIRWSVVVQIVAYAIGLAIVWNAMTNRISVVETRVDALRSDVTEVKGDVKTLLTRHP
jgi:hypothetical protein